MGSRNTIYISITKAELGSWLFGVFLIKWGNLFGIQGKLRNLFFLCSYARVVSNYEVMIKPLVLFLILAYLSPFISSHTLVSIEMSPTPHFLPDNITLPTADGHSTLPNHYSSFLVEIIWIGLIGNSVVEVTGPNSTTLRPGFDSFITVFIFWRRLWFWCNSEGLIEIVFLKLSQYSYMYDFGWSRYPPGVYYYMSSTAPQCK